MGKPLTKQERASRQRTMMKLRRWMESNGVPRQQIADELGITKGHLSTLINANRPATALHCQKAMVLMGAKFAVSKHDPRYEELGVEPIATKAKPKKRAKKKKARSAAKMRPMTKFESKFVTDVAKAWIKENKGKTKEDLVAVVRALSIGIRS